MGFNPLKEKGTPLDKQVRNWSELNVQPYDKESVDPYTRTRVILMNGIEVEGAIFKHQFARHCDDARLKQQVAMTRRVEQQQQKMVNWLVPASESVLEVTIGYEQVAVDLTAWLARTEPDKYVKAALDFALLEDFDHLYRYANLMEMTEGKDAAKVVGELTEIFPGRPTINEHRHPFDSVRKPYDAEKAEVLTKLHVLTIVAAEQQTMNFYMTVGNRPDSALARGLYLEIAQIEEQHVSHYETLADPTMTWYERMVMHEYNECYLYYSCVQSEVDQRIRGIWQRHLEDEIEHLKAACKLMQKHQGRDPEEMLPDEMPELTIFQSNKEYVREVLQREVDYTANGTKFVPADKKPDRYDAYQQMVNNGGKAPSQDVIALRIDKSGEDYRLETEGEHPVKRFRQRNRVVR